MIIALIMIIYILGIFTTMYVVRRKNMIGWSLSQEEIYNKYGILSIYDILSDKTFILGPVNIKDMNPNV